GSIALVLNLVVMTASAGPLRFESLPEGLPAPRENSEVGVLGSAVSDPYAVYYQKLLDQVESKVYGLAMTAVETPISQAEKSYYVESISLGLVRALMNDKLIASEHEREILLFRAIQIYEDSRVNGERIFEIMIRTIDAAKPGTSGIQLPTEMTDGSVVYSPNYRYERELTAEEKTALYAQKVKEFTDAGGNLSEVKVMTKETVAALPEKSMVEFVEMASEIRFTTGSAGHILMAGGQDVLSAGTMMILKDRAGVPRLLVVSNSSGSYKPDLLPVDEFAAKMGSLLNVPAEQIVITKGEPTSTQTMKILLKASGMKPDEIKAIVSELKGTGEVAQLNPSAVIPTASARAAACRAVF
ncbi:MAG: hypothetical protein AAB250_06795, partial [Bdellovibrionota bacterium]